MLGINRKEIVNKAKHHRAILEIWGMAMSWRL